MEKEIEKIISILTKCESDLREVIVEAAQEGDYRSVDIAKTAAVNVHNVKARVKNPAAKLETKPINDMSRHKRKKVSRKSSRLRYPKFEVKNETLIRIGWSKKERSEYTHKTPRAAFNRTVKVMAALAQNGAGPFMAEQIIEQVNHMESETVPSYQVYVVIGLLRKTEYIKQIGREGYSIPTDITQKAESVWGNLLRPTRVSSA